MKSSRPVAPRVVAASFAALLLAACGQMSSPATTELDVAAPLGGEIVGWGNNDFSQNNVPPLPTGTSYISVAAGAYHGLAIRSDGELVAWGWNNDGQTNVPALPTGMSYTTAAAGPYHSLALRSDGEIIAFGSNGSGQISVPALPTGTTYEAVAGGDGHSLALRSDGEIVAWGSNDYGQTDVPALPTGTRYTAVTGNGFHSSALRSDGAIIGWGDNGNGQSNVPALPTGTTYTAVADGYAHSLGLRSDGEVVAWQRNDQGQSTVPPLPSGTSYVAVAAGAYHSMALRSDGQVIAWGQNSSGQTDVPALPTGTVYKAIAAGYYNSLALKSVPPSGPADLYTADFETSPTKRIIYGVKVGQGVSYSGEDEPISDTVRVDGYQYKNGKRFGSNQVKVIDAGRDNVLTVVKAGTNTPNASGGELDIKPSQAFGGPSLGKNGLVILKSVTVDGVSTNGAKLILYGNGKAIKTLPLAKTESQTLTLDEPGVGFIQVRANDSFTVDDVVFEVATPR